MDILNNNTILNIVVDIILFLFLSIIFVSCSYDSKLRKQFSNRYYILWIGFYLINFAIDILNLVVFSDMFNATEFLKKICVGLYYFSKVLCSIPAYLWVVNMIKEKTTYQNRWKLVIVSFISIIACFFVMYVTRYSNDVNYIESSDMSVSINTWYRYFIIVYQVALSILVITKSKWLGQTETIFILLTINVVPLFDLLPIWDKRPTNIAITVFLLLIYVRIWNQRRIELAESQNELTNAKVQLMISQIQPHFLYNALGSISSLCTKDPKKAKELTINFATYLRGNLNAIGKTTLTTFDKELEHTKIYLMIEQTRFADRLNIEYDIQDTDFNIPALSLQPLVENAVKHGVCKKEDGGTVKIKTYHDKDYYIIEIDDDGVGFDINSIDFESGTHVGLSNVTNRLESLCPNSLVDIESEIGVGTVQKILIPKNINNNNNNNNNNNDNKNNKKNNKKNKNNNNKNNNKNKDKENK